MATFNKFNTFTKAIAEKVHNLASDTFIVALSNTVPVATNSQLSNITEIAYTNLSARTITTTSSTQSSGTYKLILQDLTLTATGNVATFRYIVLYNNTATNKELIGWYDFGSALSMISGDSLLIDFDGTNGVLTIA